MFIFSKRHLLLLLLPVWLIACKKDEDYSPEKFYDSPKTRQNATHYTVKSGDTLSSIGKKYQSNYQQIARWNKIAPPYNIATGQKLKIFKKATGFQKSASIASSTLKPSIPAISKPKLEASSAIAKTPPLKQPSSKLELKLTKSQNPSKHFKFNAYVVKKGDTLYSISRNFKVNSQLIQTANNIPVTNSIFVGQKLKIPNIKQKHRARKITQKALTVSKNLRIKSQKTSIISNNKKNMLKFYCQWPVAGKIYKSFSKTGYKGIEISGKVGRKVRAVAAGKVVAVNSSLYGYGTFIVIKHKNRYMTSYANNRRSLVKRGQRVNKGEVIAEMGQVGSKKPVLKFAIRKKGRQINPMRFLPKK